MSADTDNPDDLKAQIAAVDAAVDAAIRVMQGEVSPCQRAMTSPMSVAFLGPEASFSHQAALARFGQGVVAEPQQSIADIFTAVDRKRVTYGVVPVENSTYGTISDTFDTFFQTSATICGEISLRIHHNLLGLKGPGDLKEICSHPQAPGQCRQWLRQHHPDCRLTEVSSTAEAALRAAQNPECGAVASALAADRYGLKLLCENIEDSSANMTRFVVLGHDMPEATGDDKTSVLLVIEDRVGALFDALEAFKVHGINLSLIESRPSRQESWSYYFYIDFLGHISEERCQTLLKEVERHCETFKCLGSYPRAADPT